MIGRALLVLLFSAAASGADPVSWPVALFDPVANEGRPADLTLPMPCGGAMAFQRVEVPVNPSDPLDDLRVRLGQSGTEAGYNEFLRMAHLRGPFAAESGAGSAYFIGRYEVTAGQWAAVMDGDCAPAEPLDRFAQGNVTWFEAVQFARKYSEWVRENAAELLPDAGDGSAFFRLPTEDEWEYAARGGTAVPDAEFAAPLFPMDSPLAGYAVHKGPGSSSAKLRPIGLLQPNPLGLFDIYGNAEELMLEPYRLNAVGRLHGRAGGIVTRGGWFGSDPLDISSAQRTEYPPYSATGHMALALPSFGVRLVISASSVVSDASARDVRESFLTRLQAPETAGEDPVLMLEKLAADELNPARRAALDTALLALAQARERDVTVGKEGVQAMLMSGSVLLTSIWDDGAAIPAAVQLVEALKAYLDNETDQAEIDYYTPRLARAQHGLEERQDRRRLSLGAYRGTLDFLIKNSAGTPFRAAATQLFEKFEREEQIRLQDALLRLLEDMEAFRATPDMSDADLLSLAES